MDYHNYFFNSEQITYISSLLCTRYYILKVNVKPLSSGWHYRLRETKLHHRLF